MPKIYQAYYKDSNNRFTRYHGASQTKVEAEARQVAKETGLRVKVDIIEIEKPSLKSVIAMLNGGGPTAREALCIFEPTKRIPKTDVEGSASLVWRVKRRDPAIEEKK